MAFSSGPSKPPSAGALRSTGPSAPHPTIVVLGMTGDGKSNLCTWLLGDGAAFKVSDRAESCTEDPVMKLGHCFGHMADYRGMWRVVDTPGLSDSAGRDAQNVKCTVTLLKGSVKDVSAFVLVVNGQQDRMSAALKNTIKVFRGCFGPALWSNLCVVFTKWDWDKKLGGFTMKKLRQCRDDWKRWFQQCEAEYEGSRQFPEIAEIQFFAVDIPSMRLVLEECGPEELEAILRQTSADMVSSTGEQLHALYQHLFIVLAAKPAVSMQFVEARTEALHEEVVKRLEAERKAFAAKQDEQQRELAEIKARRAKEAREAKEREERLAKEAREREDRLQREARAREAELAREREARRMADACYSSPQPVILASPCSSTCRRRDRASDNSSPSWAPYSPEPSSGSSSSNGGGGGRPMSWNEFQHSLKGQGLSSTERAEKYREYKEGF